MASPPAPGSVAPVPAEASRPSLGWPVAIGLALLLVVLVYIAGSSGVDSPWILGDEFIFIARNPDVNPAAAETGDSRRAGTGSLRAIFSKVHDDLYQPIPILSYALQWSLTGGEPGSFRRADLLLHALNALLLWQVLSTLLVRFGPPGVAAGGSPAFPLVAWTLALLWALHPMLVTTYASDMGRTHLLSATFALLAFGLYLQALTPGRGPCFLAVIGALLLAMLSKPLPGWVLVALTLEALHLGWRRALRSPRVWLIAAICLGFGLLTLWTSRQAGLLEDASKGLFGDPVARSALAVWLYFRNLAAPLWLAFWYPPDPRTGWAYPLVWVGLALAAASVYHAVRGWQRPETRAVTLGWAWCWGLLLPVIGLVGAREAAATDRYFYQPLMGLALVAGVLATRALARFKPTSAIRLVVPIGALALAMLLWDLPQGRIARSTVRRAARLVDLNPGDPRALEALAAAYDFARNHPMPVDDLTNVSSASSQFQHFNTHLLDTLTQAAARDLAYYFPGPADRAPFHRRLARRFLTAGLPEQSLSQAEEARQFQPSEFATWKRLAHAYQALRRLDEATAAYQRCEELLPDRPETRVAHFTDYGSLLLFDRERDAEACPKFAAAFQAGRPPLQAKLGMALCQIRYGEGAQGFALVRQVLDADPTNTQAWLIAGEYHLSSHHWLPARAAYEAIIQEHPTHYAALRGYHEVCLQMGRPGDAVLAWADALAQEPDRREFKSYLVWALALAANDSARSAAEELLRADSHNPLACFALMLADMRSGDLEMALRWVGQAEAGEPIPKAREFERAAASLQVLLDHNDLPPEATLLQAAICLSERFPPWGRAKAAALLENFLAAHADSRYRELAERLRARLSDVKTLP